MKRGGAKSSLHPQELLAFPLDAFQVALVEPRSVPPFLIGLPSIMLGAWSCNGYKGENESISVPKGAWSADWLTMLQPFVSSTREQQHVTSQELE
jgi:hypothetical protein